MSTQAIISANNLQELVTNSENDQYALWQIVGIWALVALPMALLAWVVAPAIIPSSPLHPGITYWLMMIVGMAWQFLVSLVIIYRELGTLRWSVIRQRTWLQPPVIQEPTSRIQGYSGGCCSTVVLCPGHYRTRQISGCARGLARSCVASAPVHGSLALGYPRVPRSMVAPESSPGQSSLQLFPRRGIFVPWRPSAQDGRRVWQVRLGGKRRALRSVAPA